MNETAGPRSDFGHAAAAALTAAQKELRAAAKAHNVDVHIDGLAFACLPTLTLLHAPLAGIERYGDREFAAGAPITLLIVKSTLRSAVRNGSYVVKAQHKPQATSGKVLFLDRAGIAQAERKLFVRPWRESAVLFPDVYTDPPPDPDLIPVVTSTHVWRNNRWVVDCSGWIPYRTIYY
jgi:hypothetical protein